MAMSELSETQVAYLKALLDMAILVNCEDFEYPCYFGFPDISQEEEKDLQEKGYIGWHDGWNITNDGEKAYHASKHILPYRKKWSER